MNSQTIIKESINSKLISIISYALRLDPENVKPESRIIKDLKAESLDVLDIRFSIEQEFGVKVADHEFADIIGNGLGSTEFLEKFTVESIADFIEDRLKIQTVI
jgi:acyl carrier protein